jgi:hypothetical protein
MLFASPSFFNTIYEKEDKNGIQKVLHTRFILGRQKRPRPYIKSTAWAY